MRHVKVQHKLPRITYVLSVHVQAPIIILHQMHP